MRFDIFRFFKKPPKAEFQNRYFDLGSETNVFSADWLNSTSQTAVSSRAAMQHSAVYACVRVISQIIGSLRIDIVDAATNKNRNDLDLHYLLDFMPSNLVTARDLWEQVVIDMQLTGRAYVHIVRSKSGKILGLVRLPDHQVKVRVTEGVLPSLVYEVTREFGVVERVLQSDMLHFRNFGSANYLGETPIQVAGRSIVVGNTEEEFSQKYFDTGGKVKDIVEFPDQIDDEVVQKFKNEFNENQHDKVLVLKSGGKHKRISLSAQDSQTLESRKYSVEQICRMFGVPMVMIGSLDKATSFGKGVAEQYSFFHRQTLNPMLEKMQCEMKIKLFSSIDKNLEIRFDRTGLTKGDLEATTKAEQVELGGNGYPGTITINENRKRKGLERIDEPYADEIYKPPVKIDNNLLAKSNDNGEQESVENE